MTTLLEALGGITPISSNVKDILPNIQPAASGDSALDWFNSASGMFSGQSPTGSAGNFNQSNTGLSSAFDGSGWTVATGGSNATGSMPKWVFFMGGAVLAYFVGKR